MIGALYKKIILVFFIINVYIFPNTLDKQSYILPDFIPIQESRTSIGIKLFSSIDSENDMSLEKSLLLTNWFTNNLYMAGSISSMGYNNDISLRYTASIGYAYNINYNKFKNIVSLLGYNRFRFNNNNLDIKNISYNLLFNTKFKSLWMSISLGIIDDDVYNKSENISIIFLKPISSIFILTFGCKYSILNQEKLITPLLSLRYKI